MYYILHIPTGLFVHGENGERFGRYCAGQPTNHEWTVLKFYKESDAMKTIDHLDTAYFSTETSYQSNFWMAVEHSKIEFTTVFVKE